MNAALRACASLVKHRVTLDGVMAATLASAGILVMGEAYTRTSLGDAEPPEACRYPPTSDILTAEHVRELEQGTLVVIRNALTSTVLKATQEDVLKLVENMDTSNHDNDDDVRQDSICWVRESDSSLHGDGMIHCIKLLRGIPFLLKRHGYDKSHSFVVPRQCQLSQYLPSDGYVRHLDRCISTLEEMGLLGWWRASDYRHRTITAILYLNDNQWDSGGQLRCFKSDETFQDVNPAGGTLIIFDSSKVEHMVLSSTSDRYALTCWINGVLD